jgi:hypothetical protein
MFRRVDPEPVFLPSAGAASQLYMLDRAYRKIHPTLKSVDFFEGDARDSVK